MNLLEEHAKEKYSLPADWQPVRMSCHPPQGPTLYVELRGAVYPPVTRGPRKGRPNWRAGGPETVAIIPIADHEAWVRSWEQRTGKCSVCCGTGKTIARCSAAGTEYQPCRKCGGTGKHQ